MNHIFDTYTNCYVKCFEELYTGDKIIYYQEDKEESYTLFKCIHMLLMEDIPDLIRFRIIDNFGNVSVENETYRFLYVIFNYISNYLDVLPDHEMAIESLKNNRYVVFGITDISKENIIEKYALNPSNVFSYVGKNNMWLLSMDENAFVIFKLVTDFHILKVYDTIQQKYIVTKIIYNFMIIKYFQNSQQKYLLIGQQSLH